MMGNAGPETLSDLFKIIQPIAAEGRLDSKSVGCQSSGYFFKNTQDSEIS